MDRNEKIIDALLARIEELEGSAEHAEGVCADLQSGWDQSNAWHDEYAHAVQGALGMGMTPAYSKNVVAAIEALKQRADDAQEV